MRCKNVIIVNDFAHVNGGVGQVAFASAKELSCRGINVIVFTAVRPIERNLEDEGIRIICLGQKDILTENNRIKAVFQGCWNTKAYKVFCELLKEFDPHETIIHFHGWMKALSPSLLAVTAKREFQVVFTLHDYFAFCPNGGLFNYRLKKECNVRPSSIACLCTNCDSRNYLHKLWRYIRQIIFNYYLKKNIRKTIVYISETSKRHSEQTLSNMFEKTYYLPNPVSLENEIVDIKNNNKYLFMGRLSEEKGCVMFCQAMKELNLNGVVVGDGYMKDKLKIMYPNVDFKGWMSGIEKQRVVNEVKCFVFPSFLYETFGLVVAEMLSKGVPSIVSSKTAAKELITENVTGLFFESGDIESLKSAIIKYESLDILQMQKNIIRTFDVAKYNVNKHVDGLIDIYDDILS